MTSLRQQVQQLLGLRLRECSRPDLADLVAHVEQQVVSGEDPALCRWSWNDGVLNVRYQAASLLRLQDRAGSLEARCWQLVRLADSLGASPGAGLHYRELWLLGESAQYWFLEGGRPELARTQQQRGLQRLWQIYEREPLAGDQERLTGFAKLRELAGLARVLGVVEGSWIR